MIPLYHDFTGDTVLVVGGGTVGTRKARRFAREATVVILSPTHEETAGDSGDGADPEPGPVEPAETEVAGSIERIRAAPTAADLVDWLERTNPALAVAATDDERLNERLASEARDRGILVNRADRAGDRAVGSVVVPATVRDGPVSVAVSTDGRSPALSAHLRDRIAPELEHAGAMADLTADLRRELREADVPPERRRTALRTVVAADSVWKALDSGRSKARQEATDVIADETGDFR